ncbi:MAG TPA: ribosome maturation factor RimM [Kiloniellaceae bacterium]|nr:ribosome maturation factor RimM [Kiloniellaceae bacterium]
MSETRVCLGAFAGPHGVRGLLKVKSFTEVPEDVAAYGPLSDESGARRFEIEVLGRAGGSVLVRVQGIGDRDAAAALRGTRLFVAREALPPTEAEDYYHADLIGLAVVTREGAAIGKVKAVQNYGAGDFLVVRGADGRDLDLPFTKAVVPQVDLAGGRLIVVLPAETSAADEEGEEEAERPEG